MKPVWVKHLSECGGTVRRIGSRRALEGSVVQFFNQLLNAVSGSAEPGLGLLDSFLHFCEQLANRCINALSLLGLLFPEQTYCRFVKMLPRSTLSNILTWNINILCVIIVALSLNAHHAIVRVVFSGLTMSDPGHG